jgi:hypothetical protein
MQLGTPSPTDPWIDRRIGGAFIVRARVASVAVGTLYRADQVILGRSVLVLLLDPGLAKDREVLRRFRARTAAAARLVHPGIASLIDVGETAEGLPYVVLEHVQGETLGELIETEGALGARRAVRLFCQLLDGLAAAHARGVAHGHLSRDTVLVARPPGHGEWVKISGFAIPPPDDARSGFADDLYDAAQLFYEMLTRIRAGGVIVPPSRARRAKTRSNALDAVVLRALSMRREDRFPDAGSLRRAVEDAVERITLPETAPPRAPRAESGWTDDENHGALGRAALAARRPAVASEEFRIALGQAIVRGDVDAITDGYIDLATALAAVGDHHHAAAELREGIDLLGAGGEYPRAVARLSRFLDEIT